MNQILDNYFAETYKSTNTIINESKKFFELFKQLDFIYVYEHSLSVVNKPYFQEITDMIDRNKVDWKVSFHNSMDLVGFEKFFEEIGIPSERIIYDRMFNIDNGQLSLFPKEEK